MGFGSGGSGFTLRRLRLDSMSCSVVVVDSEVSLKYISAGRGGKGALPPASRDPLRPRRHPVFLVSSVEDSLRCGLKFNKNV